MCTVDCREKREDTHTTHSIDCLSLDRPHETRGGTHGEDEQEGQEEASERGRGRGRGDGEEAQGRSKAKGQYAAQNATGDS